MKRLQRSDHALLEPLARLIGEWRAETTIEGKLVGRSRTVNEWSVEGSFLVQRADSEDTNDLDIPEDWKGNLPFPTTMLIGVDDGTKEYTCLYTDARNVFRVYRMTVDSDTWRMWRDFPGFSQRFTGEFSADGASITARWERAMEDSKWFVDFDLVYRRL